MSNPGKSTDHRHWFTSPMKEILISCLPSFPTRGNRERKNKVREGKKAEINKEKMQLKL